MFRNYQSVAQQNDILIKRASYQSQNVTIVYMTDAIRPVQYTVVKFFLYFFFVNFKLWLQIITLFRNKLLEFSYSKNRTFEAFWIVISLSMDLY